MAGFTNRGKKMIMDAFFRGGTQPAAFNAVLCTSAVAPNPDTNLISELTEIANGNGYATNGVAITRDATGFPTMTEDDANDRGDLFMKTLTFTAAGGTLPASGGGARWLVLVDDNATPANRQVIAYFDLTSSNIVSSGQALTITTPNLRFDEV
jgi:hypothetical protein